MSHVIVAGYPSQAGKTAVIAALGDLLREAGVTVGYAGAVPPDRVGGPLRSEGEAAVLASVFGSRVAIVSIDPAGDPVAQLQAAAGRVAGDAQVVFVEVPGAAGDSIGSAGQLATALDGSVLVVARYYRGLTAEALLDALGNVREQLAGVIFNAVPRSWLGYMNEVMIPRMDSEGVRVWATAALDSVLQSVTVGQLAAIIGGRFLTAGHKGDELVEHLLIGARSWDAASPYLARKSGFAFITRADLQDVHLAALDSETTRCMVLTGQGNPATVVRYRAEEAELPIIRVEKDTVSVVRALDRAMQATGFSQGGKVKRMVTALQQRGDLDGLMAALAGTPSAAY